MRIEHCSQAAGRSVAIVCSLLAIAFCFSKPLTAQDPTITTVELVHGYVTAVHTPEGFDVSDMHILLQPLTGFRLKGRESAMSAESLQKELRPGTYVWVLGKVKDKKPVADEILFREDRNQQISGLGPVNSLVEAGGEREFRADGYTIRVPASAATSFRGDVHRLDEVGAGTWLHYKGKPDARGVIVASSADFLSTKAGKPVEVVNGLEDFKISFSLPDFAQHLDGRVKPGRLKSWHTVPADEALHDRLQRIGTKLIPPFQRALADDDPRKIRFQFYAVDGDDMRTFICAPRGGLIFYPRFLIERMKSDDQLAAALAMPIAVLLQRQGIGKEMREWPAIRDQLTTAAVYVGIGYLGGFTLDMMGALPDHKIEVRAQEQVGRISISLVADAGYNPWQAPEAFRLLAARRQSDGSWSAKNTHLSEYALSILNLEYRREAAAVNENAAASREPAK